MIACEKIDFRDQRNKLIFIDLRFDSQTSRCVITCCATSGEGCVAISSEIHETSCNQMLETFPQYVDDSRNCKYLERLLLLNSFRASSFRATPPISAPCNNDLTAASLTEACRIRRGRTYVEISMPKSIYKLL